MRRPIYRMVPLSWESEQGYVIVLVMLLLMVGLSATFAAFSSTLALRSTANRQLRVKRAQAAADAGVQTGLYRWNQLDLSTINFTSGLVSNLGSLADCVIPSLSAGGSFTFNTTTVGVSATTSTACPNPSSSGVPNAASDVERIGDHAFTYMQFVPGASTNGPNITLKPKIVATGVDDGGNQSTCSSSLTASSSQTSGCVVQRVEAVMGPIDPFQLIEATGPLTIGASALVGVATTGDVRTNQSITVTGLSYTGTALLNSPPGVLPNITYGTTKSLPTLHTVTVTQASNSVNRSAITISPSKPDCADTNGNPVSGGCAAVFGSAYNSTTDTLTLSSGSLTIPAGDYVFCNVNVTGGTLLANPTTTGPVRIFVDSPSSNGPNRNCSGQAGNFTDTPGFGLVSGVGSLLSQVGAVSASGQLQVYMASNGTAQIGSSNPLSLTSLTESMFLYAPTATVTVGTTAFDGNIVGGTTKVYATTLTQNLGLNNYGLYSGVGSFHVIQYQTCTPQWPPPSAANALNGC